MWDNILKFTKDTKYHFKNIVLSTFDNQFLIIVNHTFLCCVI